MNILMERKDEILEEISYCRQQIDEYLEIIIWLKTLPPSLSFVPKISNTAKELIVRESARLSILNGELSQLRKSFREEQLHFYG